ncbi:MAG TPA: metal ABC transporter substrate-binding protein [Patescibacteria group bacterium]|nr:metal ABC transporter substrate-binding protein [Patescibacteria group bacterium]
MWTPLKSIALAATLAMTWGGSLQAAEPLKVVATFSIIGDLVKQVGGDAVQVTTLVPPGGDAHTYEPTPNDAKGIAGANLVVVNGLHMEGWLDRLIAASATKAPIAVASKGVKPQTMEEEEAGGGKAKVVTDPHAWQNLANGQIYVRNIADALTKADPANAAGYRQRADAYTKELKDLDAWVRQQVAQVPPAKRKIITSHDAFGYFGKAYGVTFLAPVGISTESEPTAAGLGQLSDQIKKEGIKALFIENMTDPRLMETLAKESGAVIGGTVYSDSLSEVDGPAGTYVTMFRHNVPAFVAAMQKN